MSEDRKSSHYQNEANDSLTSGNSNRQNTKMKTLQFLLLLIGFCGPTYSQEATQLTRYENEECFIMYPSNLILEEGEKKGALGHTLFVISNFGEQKEFNFPIISLSVIDCAPFGMGVHGMTKINERGKQLKERKTKIHQRDFTEATSEGDGITTYEYFFVVDNIIYTLRSVTKTPVFAERKAEIERIMDSFELK